VVVAAISKHDVRRRLAGRARRARAEPLRAAG
jgi:hypothetical protein